MRRTITSVVALSALPLLLWACSAGTQGGDPPAEGYNVYAAKVQPIFESNCACHTAGSQAATSSGLVLNGDPDATYASLMGNGAIVPGKPEQSPLVDEMRTGGMPIGGGMQASAELATIEDWIRGGAAKFGPKPGGEVEPPPPPREVSDPTIFVTAEQEAASANFAFEIVSVTDPAGGAVDPGDAAVVTFQVKNPVTGQPYAILNDDAHNVRVDAAFNPVAATPATDTEPAKPKASASVRVIVGWSTGDYQNIGSGTTRTVSLGGANTVLPLPGQPATFDALAKGVVTAGLDANGAWDGTFKVTTPPLPGGVTGTASAAIFGRVLMIGADGKPMGALNTANPPAWAWKSVPIHNVVSYFAVTGGTVVPRRTVVDVEKCKVCHGHLAPHGNSRMDNVEVCVVCHNPASTDYLGRLRALDLDPAVQFPDGKTQQPLDLGIVIHQIHAGSKAEGGFGEKGLYIYGSSGSPDAITDAKFPALLQNCEVCHVAGSYGQPFAGKPIPRLTSLGADLASSDDDLFATPATAECRSCHGGSLAVAHMEQNGGSVGATRADIAAGTFVETCELCHKGGRGGNPCIP
jgi:OmcA/MtrC family decaheme c-type cytochrome